MRKYFYILSAFICALPLPEVRAESPYELSSADRVIDFGVLYPIPFVKGSTGTKRRQMGTAGFRFSYQFYLNDSIALTIVPNAWFLPVRVNGQKGTIVCASIEAGSALRLFPRSFFDPTIYASGGASTMDAGKQSALRISYPVSAEFGLNLWRQTDRFLDPNLAVHLFGGARYYMNVLPIIKPMVYHFGIAFRGSF